MLVLLNNQLVMVEMIEWARLRLVEILKIEEHHVQAKWELNTVNKLVPKFTVNELALPEIDPKLITQVYQGVSREMKYELEERLRGLKSRRVANSVFGG